MFKLFGIIILDSNNHEQSDWFHPHVRQKITVLVLVEYWIQISVKIHDVSYWSHVKKWFQIMSSPRFLSQCHFRNLNMLEVPTTSSLLNIIKIIPYNVYVYIYMDIHTNICIYTNIHQRYIIQNHIKDYNNIIMHLLHM